MGPGKAHGYKCPGKSHVEGYLNSEALIVKYEDLKQHPLGEVKKICDFLDITKSDEQLKSAIDSQSFASKKRNFLKSNDVKKADFMRKGASGEWRTTLDEEAISLVEDNLRELLNNLGYN